MKLALALLPLFALSLYLGRRDGPAVTSGDEPHYLLVTSSALYDHDLLLADDYRRVLQGGLGAGAAFAGNELDHHTILVDRRTGEHELWQRIYDWTAHEKCEQPCTPFRRISPRLQPSPSVVEVPAHPPGFSLLLALLVAPFHPAPAALERHAAVAIALLSWLAIVLLALAGRRAGLTFAEAIGAALLAGLASPWLAYSRSYFAETAIGLGLALALWARLLARPALAGAAVVLAAALKPPFGLVGVAWAADLWLQGRRREAARLFAVTALGGIAIALFNYRLAHTFVISGTAGFVGAEGPESIGVLLFGNAHGLLSFAPWAGVGLWVCARAAAHINVRAPADTNPGAPADIGMRAPADTNPRQPPGADSAARLVAVGLLPVLVLLAATNFPDGGVCYGPRYWVPFLPWLALVTVQARRARLAVAVLAAISLAIAIPGALHYRQLFNATSLQVLKSY